MKKYILIVLFLIVLTLVGCNNEPKTTVEEDLQTVLDSINIPTEVTSNLDLKDTYIVGDIVANAIWHSTASSIISDSGEVTLSLVDQPVTIALKLSIGETSISKNYDIVVKGNYELRLLYALVQNQIKFSSFDLENDMAFPTTYEQDGKTINAQWISSNPDVLENDGTIHRQDTNVDVNVKLVLSINDVTREENFTFTVLRDPSVEPVNWWHTANVWTNPITGEAVDPATPSCFPGAIYRKVVSSVDYWLGIEAKVTIPEFIPDEQRFDTSKMSYYLDNSSLYMGGHANYESDIGIAWSIGYDSYDSGSITPKGVAFRPFWRYITKKEECTNNNCFRNADATAFEYYYFPGDTIRMSVFSPAKGYLQMRIELLELTTNPKYVAQRAKFNLGNDFNRIFYTNPFPSEGMGIVKSEFKRVNAIDQVANEAKPTINTNASVNNAIWHEVYLYRMIDGDLYKVPMTENRSAAMACPLGSNVNGDFSNAFKISYTGVDKALGGEVVSIVPNNGTGRLYNLEMIIAEDRFKKIL